MARRTNTTGRATRRRYGTHGGRHTEWRAAVVSTTTSLKAVLRRVKCHARASPSVRRARANRARHAPAADEFRALSIAIWPRQAYHTTRHMHTTQNCTHVLFSNQRALDNTENNVVVLMRLASAKPRRPTHAAAIFARHTTDHGDDDDDDEMLISPIFFSRPLELIAVIVRYGYCSGTRV